MLSSFIKVARWRNASFTNSKFQGLQFYKQPRPVMSEEEGLVLYKGSVSVPVVAQDPNNAYNDVVTGYVPMFRGMFYYKKEIHHKFKKYYSGEEFQAVDIFEGYENGYEVYAVKFTDSLIETSEIKNINFIFSSFNTTVFRNLVFTDVKFDNTKILNCTFEDCTFDRCTFFEVNFKNTRLEKCRFTEPFFYNCYIGARYTNTEFHKVIFQTSVIPIDTEAYLFKDCLFVGVKLCTCTYTNYRALHTEDFIKHISVRLGKE